MCVYAHLFTCVWDGVNLYVCTWRGLELTAGAVLDLRVLQRGLSLSVEHIDSVSLAGLHREASISTS